MSNLKTQLDDSVEQNVLTKEQKKNEKPTEVISPRVGLDETAKELNHLLYYTTFTTLSEFRRKSVDDKECW